MPSSANASTVLVSQPGGVAELIVTQTGVPDVVTINSPGPTGVKGDTGETGQQGPIGVPGTVPTTLIARQYAGAVAVANDNALGYDALTAAELSYLDDWLDWLNENGASGYIGEVGWPNGDYATPNPDTPSWNALANKFFDRLDAYAVPATIWTSGSVWNPTTNRVAYYASQGYGHPIDSRSPSTDVLEAHNAPGIPLRGTNVNGLDFGAVGNEYLVASWQYLASRGVQLVRLPVEPRRLFPLADWSRTGGPTVDPSYANYVMQTINAAATTNIKLLFASWTTANYDNTPDNPNYWGVAWGNTIVNGEVDTTAYPISDFAKESVAFVKFFKDNNVTNAWGYALANEPANIADRYSKVRDRYVWSGSSGLLGWTGDGNTTLTATNSGMTVAVAAGHTGTYIADAHVLRSDSDVAGATYGVVITNTSSVVVNVSVGYRNQDYSASGGSFVAIPAGQTATVAYRLPPQLNGATWNCTINAFVDNSVSGAWSFTAQNFSVGTSTTGAEVWQLASQAAVVAVRQAGYNDLLSVGGYDYCSLPNWRADQPKGWISDPADNFVYEAHSYWDFGNGYLDDKGGAYATNVVGAVSRGFSPKIASEAGISIGSTQPTVTEPTLWVQTNAGNGADFSFWLVTP